jgi:hypothetical protein
MKKLVITSIFIFQLVFLTINGQTIDNLKAIVKDNDIVLTYNIKDAKYGQKFNIELWYSVNNGEYVKCQTINCSDGTNIDINAGDDKRITWYVLKDLNNLVCSTLDFEVRATVNTSAGRGRR